MNKLVGKYQNEDIHLFKIENDNFIVAMIDYGGTLVCFYDKLLKRNLVLGYKTVESYIDNDTFMGATVGRVCNRIGDGTYSLNGKTYHLDKNNKGNTLHSGSASFGHRIYEGRIEENSIIFHMNSLNGDGGFNGDLSFDAIYTLVENGLRFKVIAKSNEDTILSPTNHAYFNLDGSSTVLDHMLELDSKEYVPIDKNGLAKDEIQSVIYTPFDFQKAKLVGKDIREPYEQLMLGCGYDHHFIVDGEGMRHFARLSVKDVELNVYSTLPGLQVYSANFLGAPFRVNGAICLETQYVPNAINSTLFEDPILKANKVQEYETFYEITH